MDPKDLQETVNRINQDSQKEQRLLCSQHVCQAETLSQMTLMLSELDVVYPCILTLKSPTRSHEFLVDSKDMLEGLAAAFNVVAHLFPD